MMNLLIDAHVFDGKYQGTRTYIEGLYKELIKHSSINFYFVAERIDILKCCFGEQLNVHYVKLQTSSKIKRLTFEFPRIIKQYEIDYAHFQYISPFLKTCKEIVTIHDLLFMDMPEFFPKCYRVKNEYLFRRSAKRADILLTVSEFSQNEISNFFGIPKNKIGITYNGVIFPKKDSGDTGILKKHNLGKYIMTVSRIEPRKNHLSLLMAFNELRLFEKGYKLVFVGGYDWSNKKFDNYFKGLEPKVKDSVIIITASYPELLDLYKHAELFVFPSYGEGFGIPPIEALAFNCPTLCSNATAMGEFGLPDNMTFNPYKTHEMKDKILAMLNGKNDICTIRNEVLKKYDWKKTADKFYNILLMNNNCPTTL